jgi:hypothetical protein
MNMSEDKIQGTDADQAAETIKPVVARYRTTYGNKLDAFVGDMFKTMMAARDGDSLMLLTQHLCQSAKLIREQIEATPAVIIGDADGQIRMQ